MITNKQTYILPGKQVVPTVQLFRETEIP